MSGGAYDYYQYHIQDIIDRIEREVEDATKERPAKVTRKFTSVTRMEELGNGRKRTEFLTQYADWPFVEVRTRFVNDPNMDIVEDTDTTLVVVTNSMTSTEYTTVRWRNISVKSITPTIPRRPCRSFAMASLRCVGPMYTPSASTGCLVAMIVRSLSIAG